MRPLARVGIVTSCGRPVNSRRRAARGERFFVRFASCQKDGTDDHAASLGSVVEVKLKSVLAGRHSLANVVGKVESDRVCKSAVWLIGMAEQFVLITQQIDRDIFDHRFASVVQVAENVSSREGQGTECHFNAPSNELWPENSLSLSLPMI